jgi:hypothetical protein
MDPFTSCPEARHLTVVPFTSPSDKGLSVGIADRIKGPIDIEHRNAQTSPMLQSVLP